MKKMILFFGLILLTTLSFAQDEQDWAFLGRYRLENDSIKQTKNFPEVIFMGNSITDGWYQQRSSFFEKNNFLSRGIGGQTTPQMLIRFTPDVIDLKPKIVVILAGTNDIAGNTGFSSVKMITDNLAAMAQLAKSHGIQVILSSILPVDKYPWSPQMNAIQMIAEVNLWSEAYSNENGFIYLDYFSTMVDESLGMKKMFSGDGVHPNIQGYEMMEPQVLHAIEEALKIRF